MDAFFAALQLDERTQIVPDQQWHHRRSEDADDLSSFRARERRVAAATASSLPELTSIPVLKKFSFSSVMVEKAVAKRVEAAIVQQVDRDGAQQVPYSVVDDIIAEHAKRQTRSVIGLYIVSVAQPTKPYQYGYSSSKLIAACTSSVQAGKVAAALMRAQTNGTRAHIC